MPAWDNLKDRIVDGLENWTKTWKDPEVSDKSILASLTSIVAPVGYPEHPGWRKEVQQNIENRRIDKEASNFLDQLSASQRNIQTPEPNQDKEIER